MGSTGQSSEDEAGDHIHDQCSAAGSEAEQLQQHSGCH